MRGVQREVNRVVERFVSEVFRIAQEEAIKMVTAKLEKLQLEAGVVAPNQLQVLHRQRVPREARGWHKRTPSDLRTLASSFTALVKASPGLRMEDISKRLETTTKALRLTVRRLVVSGVVRTRGFSRARRYFAGTSEHAARVRAIEHSNQGTPP